MAKRFRDRDRRPGRRAAFRDPRPITLVVCEGKSSEPEYLLGLSKANRNSRVTLRIAPESGVPMTLLQAAKKHKKEAEQLAKGGRDLNLAYDSVWCIFDVDDHPRIAEVRSAARDCGIKLAISNPCFELWLLLHFRGSPGMQHRSRIVALLRTFIANYDKHVDFAAFSDGYSIAVSGATQLWEVAEAAGESCRNPSTNVFELTECIRAESTQ